MEKMSREMRAKQFMPFKALQGYYDEIKAKEKIKCEKKELSEERETFLSATVSELKKGDAVKVEYYDKDGYVFLTGVVTAVDTVFKTITIVKKVINFSDVYDLEILEKTDN